MSIEVKRFYTNGKELPVEDRICIGCINNNKICNCNVYSGDTTAPLNYQEN